MPLFEVELAIAGDLRLSREFTAEGYHFSPSTNGFSLVFDVSAGSSEEARSQATAKAQVLVDSITFTKGPSLRCFVSRITQRRGPEEGTSRVLTTTVSIAADAYLVLKCSPEGIEPGLQMARRVESHPKAEVLTRALRWFARGVADSDKVDKFADFWIALEALADSYEGTDVEPYLCKSCRHVINPRPVGGLLRAYLRSFGMNTEAESMHTLSAKRGKLFHRALESRALESLGQVERILKTCIQHETCSA